MCKRFPTLNGYEFRPKVKFGSKPPITGVVFVGNMTDLFGEWNTHEDIDRWICQMSLSGKAEYLVLTKRTKRMREIYPDCPHPFVNIGMTAENQKRYDERFRDFRFVSFRGYHWLSAEPLLGPINLMKLVQIRHPDNEGYGVPSAKLFSWVVVGAESGPNRRPCELEWVEQIVETCQSCKIPVFVKQLDLGGKLVKEISKFPEHLQIRQVPWAIEKGASK